MDTKDAGRMGGIAKVPTKGFGSLTAKQRKENGKRGALARWGKGPKKKAAAKKKATVK
jgi:hypothetical protein